MDEVNNNPDDVFFVSISAPSLKIKLLGKKRQFENGALHLDTPEEIAAMRTLLASSPNTAQRVRIVNKQVGEQLLKKLEAEANRPGAIKGGADSTTARAGFQMHAQANIQRQLLQNAAQQNINAAEAEGVVAMRTEETAPPASASAAQVMSTIGGIAPAKK